MDDLLHLCLSSSSSDDECTPTPAQIRASKLHQTESQFQSQKAFWRPQVYPLESEAVSPTTKEAFMSIKAAAENLYYRRDYSAAMELAMLALRGSAADSVHGLEKKELVVLVEACRRRFASLRTV